MIRGKSGPIHLAVVSMGALAVFAAPLLAPNAYVIGVLILLGIYTILALGMSILFGFAGQISLGHAAFYGLGAYVSAVLTTATDTPFPFALVAGAVAAGVLGYFVGRPILHLAPFYLAMATLVVGEVAQVAFRELRPLTGGAQGLTNIPRPVIGGIPLDSNTAYYYIVAALAAGTFLFMRNLTGTDVGRALRSIKVDETAAASVGVDVVSYKARAFALSSALAGVAGVLYAHFARFISPDSFGLDLSISLLVGVVVGGSHRIAGALVGAIFLILLPEFLRAYGSLNEIAYGVILLVVVVIMPDGIVGFVERAVSAVARLSTRWRATRKSCG